MGRPGLMVDGRPLTFVTVMSSFCSSADRVRSPSSLLKKSETIMWL
jgi:hypothetical protein